jgi:hypothetical protein
VELSSFYPREKYHYLSDFSLLDLALVPIPTEALVDGNTGGEEGEKRNQVFC